MFAGIFSCTPSFSPEINKVYSILSYLRLQMDDGGRYQDSDASESYDTWYDPTTTVLEDLLVVGERNVIYLTIIQLAMYISI